ncbi:unnamed protein product [Dovyalis caffra]|uniref:ATP-dependent Clp protease proteolytic subunit n=1 Tax=Dovyalis caffra TaxID=77055 RepID=A0AAV1SU92_9ROSI|nr:unnamed protein product [Dovyalis caffra]
MAVATATASTVGFHKRLLASPKASSRTISHNRALTLSSSPPFSSRVSLSACSLSPFCGDFSGTKIRPECLNPASISSSKGKRSVVTMVIPYTRGTAWEQPPPDLASYLFKNRIVYLGMSLVPSVTELILAEFLYLQYEDEEKPIYLYINSTGTTKGGEKLGYETEAFAIYDVMGYVKPPIFTLCVGNAWGEAALLLAAGSKGNRSALPSSTIMMKQPIGRFQGQATDVELARKEIKNVKAELVNLLAKHIGKLPEEIEADISRPKYFSPNEAVEYGIIDKVVNRKRVLKEKQGCGKEKCRAIGYGYKIQRLGKKSEKRNNSFANVSSCHYHGNEALR